MYQDSKTRLQLRVSWRSAACRSRNTRACTDQTPHLLLYVAVFSSNLVGRSSNKPYWRALCRRQSTVQYVCIRCLGTVGYDKQRQTCVSILWCGREWESSLCIDNGRTLKIGSLIGRLPDSDSPQEGARVAVSRCRSMEAKRGGVLAT